MVGWLLGVGMFMVHVTSTVAPVTVCRVTCPCAHTDVDVCMWVLVIFSVFMPLDGIIGGGRG